MFGFDTDISLLHFVANTKIRIFRGTESPETMLWRQHDKNTCSGSLVSNEDERTQHGVETH